MDREVLDALPGSEGDQRLEVTQARVHAPVAHEPDQMDPRPAHRVDQDLVEGQRALLDGFVDPRQVLLDHRAGAEVQMPDLAVTHLPLGQPDGSAARRQLGMRVARPQIVEHRGVGELDRVAGSRRGEPPPVEHDEADRRMGHGAAAVIAANDSGSSDAPPTSAPSTSGSASSPAGLSGFTEPPYRIRVRSACSGSRSATSARTKPIASWACSGVAFLPVPIAQIGSQAITTSPSRSACTFSSPSCTWWRSLRSVSPASRSSSVSPTHSNGTSPASSAAGTFACSARSVSPKSCRRSECPRTVPCTSSSLSIRGLTSPVNGPSGASCMFCAYTVTPEPRVESTIACNAVNGTQMATSAVAADTRGSRPWMYSSASAIVLYIFQLPAISGVRAASATENLHSGEGLPLDQLWRRAAARGEMVDLVGETELGERSRAVAAAHDRRPRRCGDRLGDRPGARRERLQLERAHRPIPEYRPGPGDLLGIEPGAARPDVEAHPALRHVDAVERLRLGVGRELAAQDEVLRQEQPAALLLGRGA